MQIKKIEKDKIHIIEDSHQWIIIQAIKIILIIQIIKIMNNKE